ncbi:hypothetical protein [Mesorhizobium sp. f-mel]
MPIDDPQGTEEPLPPADPPDAAGADPDPAGEIQGGLDIDDKLDFEVHLLAMGALRGIAADIAKRVKSLVGSGSNAAILVADSSVVSAIADWRIMSRRMSSLQEALDSLLFDLEPVEETESIEFAGGIGGLTNAIGAVSNLLSYFAADTTWKGRVVDVVGALRPALLGQLIAHDLEPIAVDGAMSATLDMDDKNLVGTLQRLLVAKAKVSALAALDEDPAVVPPAEPVVADGENLNEKGEVVEAAPEAGDATSSQKFLRARAATLSVAVNELLADIKGETLSTRLLLAASEACAIAEASKEAYLLEANVIRAGGHYRLRKHLLTYVFGCNDLTYSAGAAVGFSLTDLKRGRVVLADTLFHASSETRFGGATKMVTPSNLTSKNGDVGLKDLPLRTFVLGDNRAEPVSTPGSIDSDHRRPTPNGGDDEAAETIERLGQRMGDDVTEAVSSWRVAESLRTLISQINARAPNRSRASDGSIGDGAHQTRNSDHNPWVHDGAMGVVTAIDVTNDPRNGCSAEMLAESFRSAKDPRIKYIIWNRRIASSEAIGGGKSWAWRPYSGSNPHNKHIHISVKPEKVFYDSTAAWRI